MQQDGKTLYNRGMATPLQQRLREGPVPAAPGPLDALRLARRAFMAGERLDMQALAADIGVNRATLYRWVGTKEVLVGEVISELSRETFAAARREVPGEGPDHVAAVVEHVLQQIHTFEPMRRFLERDPEYALRVLTSKESTVQRTSIDLVRDLLAEEVARGALETPLDLDDLAYVIIRIGESFLYSDVIVGSEPNAAKAGQILRMLLR
jgi:AcrR family transcriptional regulator